MVASNVRVMHPFCILTLFENDIYIFEMLRLRRLFAWIFSRYENEKISFVRNFAQYEGMLLGEAAGYSSAKINTPQRGGCFLTKRDTPRPRDTPR